MCTPIDKCCSRFDSFCHSRERFCYCGKTKKNATRKISYDISTDGGFIYIFQVKNKEGVKSTGPKVDFIMDDYRTNIWNSDLLEKVEVWDKDLEVEN